VCTNELPVKSADSASLSPYQEAVARQDSRVWILCLCFAIVIGIGDLEVGAKERNEICTPTGGADLCTYSKAPDPLVPTDTHTHSRARRVYHLFGEIRWRDFSSSLKYYFHSFGCPVLPSLDRWICPRINL